MVHKGLQWLFFGKMDETYILVVAGRPVAKRKVTHEDRAGTRLDIYTYKAGWLSLISFVLELLGRRAGDSHGACYWSKEFGPSCRSN